MKKWELNSKWHLQRNSPLLCCRTLLFHSRSLWGWGWRKGFQVESRTPLTREQDLSSGFILCCRNMTHLQLLVCLLVKFLTRWRLRYFSFYGEVCLTPGKAEEKTESIRCLQSCLSWSQGLPLFFFKGHQKGHLLKPEKHHISALCSRLRWRAMKAIE